MFMYEDEYGAYFSFYLLDVGFFLEEVDYKIKEHNHKPDYYNTTWLTESLEMLTEYLTKVFANFDLWLEEAEDGDEDILEQLLVAKNLLHETLT